MSCESISFIPVCLFANTLQYVWLIIIVLIMRPGISNVVIVEQVCNLHCQWDVAAPRRGGDVDTGRRAVSLRTQSSVSWCWWSLSSDCADDSRQLNCTLLTLFPHLVTQHCRFMTRTQAGEEVFWIAALTGRFADKPHSRSLISPSVYF